MYHPRFDIFIFVMVFISIIMLVIELTHPNNNHAAGWMGDVAGKETNPIFLQVDIFLTLIFTLEYVIKFWIAPKKWQYFSKHFIELLALLPVLRIFRMIRILRILRLLRLIRLNTLVDQKIGLDNHQTSDMVTVLMYLFFSIIFGTVGIMIFERGENDGFQTLMDGLWWCIVTITTVGYGDISPITVPGKIVAICIMFIGLAFYASLTGVISEALIMQSRREKKLRMEENMFRQHIIVCGWNQHANVICQQILNDEDQLILVLSSREQDIQRTERIYIKNLDPTQGTSLQECKIMFASAIILLSDERLEDPFDRDARNILIAMNAKAIRPDIPIIFQLEQEENNHHVQQLGINRIVHVSKLAGIELQKLLSTNNQDTVNLPFEEQRCPKMLQNNTFAQAMLHYAQQGKIVVGIRRDNRIQVPCPKETHLKEGDTILVVC